MSGKKNTSALEDLIEQQAEKITRYETKIRDVVSAYKSLQNEKNALEETVKALSISHETRNNAQVCVMNSPLNTPDSVCESQGDDDATSTKEQNCSDCVNLRKQLATLTNSISTLTAEKNRMDSTYKADKRAIKVNLETEINELKNESKSLQIVRDDLQNRLTIVEKQLVEERNRREMAENDKNKQIKQIQNSLTKMIDERETMEEELFELRMNNKTLSSKLTSMEGMRESVRSQKETQLVQEIAACQAQLQENENELELCKKSLKAKTDEVQKLMTKWNESRAYQSKLEEKWSAEQTRLLLDRAAREQDLETRISELSQLLGEAERQHANDEMEMNHLREKVQSLQNVLTTNGQENQWSKPTVATVNNETTIDLLKDTKLENDCLLFIDDDQEISHLWTTICAASQKLQKVNQRLHDPLPLASLFTIFIDYEPTDGIGIREAISEHLSNISSQHHSTSSNLTHLTCCSQLKELKLQLQNSISKREFEESYRNIEGLRQRIQELQEELLQTEQAHADTVERMKIKLKEMDENNQFDICRLTQKYDTSLCEVQNDLQNHRNRSLRLLEDKDNEINLLQKRISLIKGSKKSMTTNVAAEIRLLNEETGLEKILSKESKLIENKIGGVNSAAGQDCTLVHCCEEKARKDSEIIRLRSDKHQLEQTVRALKQQMIQLEEEHENRLNELKGMLHQERISLNKPENTTNEYLRNIIFRYITMQQTQSDFSARANIIRAIASVLHFDSQQLAVIDKICSKRQ